MTDIPCPKIRTGEGRFTLMHSMLLKSDFPHICPKWCPVFLQICLYSSRNIFGSKESLFIRGMEGWYFLGKKKHTHTSYECVKFKLEDFGRMMGFQSLVMVQISYEQKLGRIFPPYASLFTFCSAKRKYIFVYNLLKMHFTSSCGQTTQSTKNIKHSYWMMKCTHCFESKGCSGKVEEESRLYYP